MDERPTAQTHNGSASLRDAARGQRLQRVMADAGVASRRICEQLIEAGRVKVNGQVVQTLPAWVDPSRDRILVDGQPVEKPEPHLYIMLNKPARTLATPPEGPDDTRRSVFEMVEHPLAARLFAAGRLDFEATGLLLLTNDGELANRITHARYGVSKTYQMVVRGTMDDESLDRVNRAIAQVTLRAAKEAGIPRAARADLTIVARESGRTVLELTVRDGRAVLVRDTLAALGHPVKSMERVAIGPVRLSGVAMGQWRELERDELSDLRRVAAGKEPRSASEKGVRLSGPRKRRGTGGTLKPKIAKRFRGIGEPIALEPTRPGPKARVGPGKPRAAGPNPRSSLSLGASQRASRSVASPRAEADGEGPDRRRGRGPGVNKDRSKPVKASATPRGQGGVVRPDRAPRSTRDDRPDRASRADREDRPARAPRRGPTGPPRSDRDERPTRAERPERTGRSGRAERAQRDDQSRPPPRDPRSRRPSSTNPGKPAGKPSIERAARPTAKSPRPGGPARSGPSRPAGKGPRR